MRKIKSKERDNGMRYCTFCKPEKVHAIYRNTNLRCDRREEKLCFACENHKNLLVDGTAVNPPHDMERDSSDDYYMEADYQTWMRL